MEITVTLQMNGETYTHNEKIEEDKPIQDRVDQVSKIGNIVRSTIGIHSGIYKEWNASKKE
ncbi:hypothetical protein [Paenibacillus polymyxa]|uniref:hypothetical protein n=1 Tax=Paenibacillus polymyxa TaxID=1406 RepID=UPI00129BEEF7|nr:hypothetical protein [Paenibacillus polymyxa]KAE8559113.1 hypothetical protein BJH92_15995 [Paenibacillus polymyxa]MCJ1222263.1 hypothetical protein [Paenibacillus polymyxa]